jgi:hypothetical protein
MSNQNHLHNGRGSNFYISGKRGRGYVQKKKAGIFI